MPKVVKKNPNQVPSPLQNGSSSPSASEEKEQGVKLTVYGRGKTGKTRMACSFPKPLLLIGTEDGTKSIATGKVPYSGVGTAWDLTLKGKRMGITFVPLTISEQLATLAGCIRSGELIYRSVVLDHGGGLQDLVTREVLGLSEIPVQRSWGMAQQQDWGVIGAQTKERLRVLLDLADTHGIHVVIIAHERNFGEGQPGDLLLPSVGAALTPSVTGWLNGATDYICQTFIRERVVETEVEIAGTKQTSRQVQGCEYCLRVGPHPVYQTGFRVPPEVVLPDCIVNPDYGKIRKLIDGD